MSCVLFLAIVIPALIGICWIEHNTRVEEAENEKKSTFSRVGEGD